MSRNESTYDPLLKETIRRGLEDAAEFHRAAGLPVPKLEGQLLRPTMALAVVPKADRHRLDRRFWSGCLAIQCVHEASLLHDDILDDAELRRGRRTVVSAKGVEAALIGGDHLLTAAYEIALGTECASCLELFVRAVRNTVSGEIRQGRAIGRMLELEEYRTIIAGKSGQLFGAALGLYPSLIGSPLRTTSREVGVRIGSLYQLIDDFLDYVPESATGKETLQDYRQRKWSWVVQEAEIPSFDLTEEQLRVHLFRPRSTGGRAPRLRAAHRWLESEMDSVIERFEALGTGSDLVRTVVDRWRRKTRDAVVGASARETLVGLDRLKSTQTGRAGYGIPDGVDLAVDESWDRYFRRHGRTFHLASRLFPPDARRLVAGVYAFCRMTDDLVDDAEPWLERARLEKRLDSWEEMASHAYDGGTSGHPLLDRVMTETRDREVPFHYARDLIEGVRMDLRPRQFRSVDDLRVYSYRVAGVVGGWMTELFGVRDPWVLERAFSLGHAMQLTNILRDVGEDLERGRLYLPTDLMDEFRVERRTLERVRIDRTEAPEEYRMLIASLIDLADRWYEDAMPGIRHLPRFVQGPVVTAARMYQAIHHSIRGNRFDNLSLRAVVPLRRKVWTGGRALWNLRALRRSEVHGTDARLADKDVELRAVP